MRCEREEWNKGKGEIGSRGVKKWVKLEANLRVVDELRRFGAG